MDLTPDQITKLASLGIEVENVSRPVKNEKLASLSKEVPQMKSERSGFKPVFPLLSISGLTLLSFGGLVLLKGSAKQNDASPQNTSVKNNPALQEPTQVPKSIQHYLLTSQQLFSKALQQQSSCTGDSCGRPDTIELLNQSILAATTAIKEFPQDYRGYQQRGRIYQSLIDSKPDLINQSISDISTAQKLNPQSAEITYSLASLYAKKGDAQNAILYLNQTVALEPTKAQNFYDLAKIQQQVGLLPQALETYTRLITLVTDSTQKVQIESEKSALEKLISQNINPSEASAKEGPPSEIRNLPSEISTDSPTIQALADTSLIIAAPEDNKNIEVTNQTESNSLSGNSKIPLGQKEISISNNKLTSTSQVYVTTTKGGKNQNLQVLSKSEKSFIVGFDSPLNEEVEFKWWIIN